MVSFGLSMGISSREPISRLPALVNRAENLGFDAFYVLDSQVILKDAYIGLAIAAQSTNKIMLGTGVTNPVTRDLSVITTAFSAIQELSDGRAILGIGNGATAVDPISLSPASLSQMEKSIRLLTGLLAGEEVIYRGKPIRILAAGNPVPIFLSASQPKMLKLAGKIADGVILMGSSTPSLVAHQINIIKDGANEAGRDIKNIFIDLWQTISVSDNKHQAFNDVKSWVASQSKYWLQKVSDLPPEVVDAVNGDELFQASENYKVDQHLSLKAKHKDFVSDEMADLMAIAGDSEYCSKKLSALASLGVNQITLTLLSGGREDRLNTLAEVIKSVKVLE
jgi:5,10-methylenetetrahydromethanopterin reductase